MHIYHIFRATMKHQGEIPFIHILRAMAPLPVMWAHLALMAEWQYHGTWLPLTLFDRMVAGPLHLYQSGGHLGVIVFFLISGYIISHVAEREERMFFAVKRVFRLFPALIVAITILSILNTVGSISRPHIKVTDYLLSMFLLDQFFWPQATVLQVTWTLFPEVVFYAIVCAFMPLIKVRPVASTFTLALTSYLVVALTDLSGNAPSHTSHLGYLPIFIVGRVFFLVQNGKMAKEVALAFIAFSLLILYGTFAAIWPDQMWNDPRKPWTYPLAIVIFYCCMLWNPQTMPKAVRFLGNISYSLYLIHVPVGWFIMDKVQPLAGFTIGFIASVAASILAAWLIYTRIEVPGRVFGRKVITNLEIKRKGLANAEG
ncbi:acyltransferase [Agrobacterium tumefaciens]|uniref:acyltransferase family protein n=1 Tax=Agrobacterium tumefaciens TaxID=358 RepID=UPI001571A7B7|nr:acyltransferase [Agrobacterium tumefaciens]NSZ71260.1 acyltransferase [Agrobacterium tumefaciens]